jgi:hypothetical protein
MRDTIRKSANRYSRQPMKNRRSTAANDRVAAGRLQASNALRDNRCPTCGGPVRQNLSLTGWVQCAQFGAVGFRLDANRPACDWQGFTS